MKKFSCCCDSKVNHNIGLLILRLTVGFLFIMQGWGKFSNYLGAVDVFSEWGFPFAAFTVYFVGGLELLGGVAVILGLFTRVFALLLSILLLVALIFVHTKMPIHSAFLAIALFGSTMALFGLGAGDWRIVKSECVCGK